ncbi:MAG TPA: phosphomannomutase [Rhodospirillaceae bacterium]|jgi:phosphomannomutase|nr:phosphomannomutase/phosphoglucomutase [Alphaproteobacteria bacterium]HBH26082.1 phosphomannomutase [Rhodospirillaceae bacterium]
MPHTFAPEILRAYDIRGRVGDTLTQADARALGRAFVAFLGLEAPRVVVGRDGRTHSPALAAALTDGLAVAGARVVDIGLGPTPMLYFAVHHLDADGGIMVTGSHNPPADNGFKMMRAGGPVFGADIQRIGQIAAQDAATGAPGQEAEARDVMGAYIDRLLADLAMARPLKVAWDCGNGAAGAVLPQILARLPGEHIALFTEVDGRFPNHHPDPTVDANLADLRRAVLDGGCDLGIAFDGDGDRIGVVDEGGRVIRGDMLMVLYAREVLREHPGAPIIGDVKCSQILFDEIERAGGRPVMVATGHSLVKAKMAEIKAPLAGELSGHIFFADRYYGYDDALYCSIRLLNIASVAPGPVSFLLGDLPRLHATPEIRIEVPEADKFAIVARVAQRLAEEGARVDTTDGVRVTTDEGWWGLRASNTQAALVARAEAATPQALERLRAAIDAKLH